MHPYEELPPVSLSVGAAFGEPGDDCRSLGRKAQNGIPCVLPVNIVDFPETVHIGNKKAAGKLTVTKTSVDNLFELLTVCQSACFAGRCTDTAPADRDGE